MHRLRIIAENATSAINEILVSPLTDEQIAKVEDIVETAVIKAMLEGKHRAVDAAVKCCEADQDTAHKIATAIREENDALIANLSSLR